MKTENHNAKKTLVLVLLLVGAVAALWRTPIADAGAPDPGVPVVITETEPTEPEVMETEPAETEPVETEPTAPEVTEPETTVPETTVPETTVPETEPVHMHEWVTTTVGATCLTDGYVHEECASCGDVRRHDVTPAHGHNHEHTEHQDPQVGVEGWDKYVCSHCGDTYYVYIPALPEETREGISGSWDMDF